MLSNGMTAGRLRGQKPFSEGPAITIKLQREAGFFNLDQHQLQMFVFSA
jgi:hypothetical protein